MLVTRGAVAYVYRPVVESLASDGDARGGADQVGVGELLARAKVVAVVEEYGEPGFVEKRGDTACLLLQAR